MDAIFSIDSGSLLLVPSNTDTERVFKKAEIVISLSIFGRVKLALLVLVGRMGQKARKVAVAPMERQAL